jgi:hypothetical protein
MMSRGSERVFIATDEMFMAHREKDKVVEIFLKKKIQGLKN